MELDSRERVLREKDTYLRCDYMVYRSLDKGDVVEVSGNVRVYQDDKHVKDILESFPNKSTNN